METEEPQPLEEQDPGGGDEGGGDEEGSEEDAE